MGSQRVGNILVTEQQQQLRVCPGNTAMAPELPLNLFLTPLYNHKGFYLGHT